MRRGRVQLESVGQRVLNQIGDVPIREGVDQVIPLPASNDESFGAKYAKPLRNGRELLIGGRDDLGHAQLAALEQIQNPQARASPIARKSCAARSSEAGGIGGSARA